MIHFKKAVECASIIVIALTAIAACSTPRGLQHKASRPVAQISAVKQSAQVAQFAKNVSMMSVGSSDIFEFSPVGNAMTVNALNFYTNALNQKCRKAVFETSATVQEFAVCTDDSITWYYIPSLNKAINK